MTSNVPPIIFHFNIEYKFILQTIQSNSINIQKFLETSLSNQSNKDLIKYNELQIINKQKEYEKIPNINQNKLEELNKLFAKDIQEEEFKNSGFHIKTKKTKKQVINKTDKKLYDDYVRKEVLQNEIINLQNENKYYQNNDVEVMTKLISYFYMKLDILKKLKIHLNCVIQMSQLKEL